MANTLPGFIKLLEEKDPELYKVTSQLAELAMAPGALDAKTKVLIAMALDAAHGAREGVEALAGRARILGASEAEIREALRIAYYVAGNGTLATAVAAYPVSGSSPK